MSDPRSVAAFVIVLVFGASAAVKLRHPVRFARGVASYGLLPAQVSYVVAALVLLSEALVALCHASGHLMPEAAYGAVVLLSGFGGLTLVTLRRGQSRPCLCFDTSGQEHTSLGGVARLCLLIACESLVLSGRADSLNTLWDFWQAGQVIELMNVAVVATVVVVSGRWILRLGQIASACRARRPVVGAIGAAESQFEDWDAAA